MTDATPRRFGWLHVLTIALVAAVVASGATLWIWRTYVFPTAFRPVTLNADEEQALEQKLARLEDVTDDRDRARPRRDGRRPDGDRLEPEVYRETAADREVRFSERELNALVANSPELARRVAVDLSASLISARALIPVDEDFPMLGGRTLRVRAGLELAYADGQPIVVLRGISIMGVPIPNAWLGGIKNIDLVEEFGGEPGFWKAFAAGVDLIEVRDGELFIRLKE
jgi:hypothetical protein